MDESSGSPPAAWRNDLRGGPDSLFTGRAGREPDVDYRTLTYEVTGRIARITFNRPDQGNAITVDTPVELSHAVERADLDPGVHVIVVSGRGKGFCGGYDLSIFAENGGDPSQDVDPHTVNPRTGTVLDPVVQARDHDPVRTWDPMIDYSMMSRFNRGFARLLHANKPTVAKLHGFAVAGGTDIALYADQIICADDTRIGYPPTRVWGVPGCGASPPPGCGLIGSAISAPNVCCSLAIACRAHRRTSGGWPSRRCPQISFSSAAYSATSATTTCTAPSPALASSATRAAR